ncbi:MAG: family 20 glycosylhydrolase [Clostridia bacterium]|nr:family 20 glycosylhydrolase [Clostridia bacterium]
MVSLIPTPRKLTVQSEEYHAVSHTVWVDVELWRDAMDVFCDAVSRIYDVKLSVASGGVSVTFDGALPPDAYALDSTEGVVIRASTREGACYGLATALQLLRARGGKLSVPAVVIEDQPDKEYRSLMVSTGRIYHPFDKLLKYIDLCFFYKVKYFHFHFADSGLYTIPSKAFPKLCKPGKYYTYEQLKVLNDYAAARGIMVIPELECPGHTKLLAETYPDVFADHEEDGAVCSTAGFEHGGAGVVCVGSERSFAGIKALIREVVELFPNAPYIHIGGDEAPFGVWEKCADCRAYMATNGIENAYDLYGEYVGRVASFVLSLGKTPMVWEGFSKECAHRIPKETVVIAWESRYQLANELLENGFRIISASWKPLYIVLPYRYAHYGWRDVMDWDVHCWKNWHPKSVATKEPLRIEPTDRLLGGTMCAWSMHYEQLISRLLENLPAFAERLWSVERHLDADTYWRMAEPLAEKAVRLIAD